MLGTVTRLVASNASVVVGALVGSTLRAGAVLLVAVVAVGALRRQSAALRHLVWVVALTAGAAMPLATRLVPAWTVTLPGVFARVGLSVASPLVPTSARGSELQSARSQRVEAVPLRAPRSGGEATLGTAPSATTSRDGTGAATLPLAVIVVGWWLLIAGVLGARSVANVVLVARLTRGGDAMCDSAWVRMFDEVRKAMGVRRDVRLVVADVPIPMTWGIARPVILLPRDCGAWHEQRRESVVRHELGHVARFDAATQCAVQLCAAVYWFNPLVWLVARAIRMERERACDDLVLAGGMSPAAYAGELVAVARCATHIARHGVALAMAHPSQLEARVVSILDVAVSRAAPGRIHVMVIGVASLAACVPLAAVKPVARDAPSTIQTVQVVPAAGQVAPSQAGSSPANARLRTRIDELGPTPRVRRFRADTVASDSVVSVPFSDDALCRPTHVTQAHATGRPMFPDRSYFLDRLSGGIGTARGISNQRIRGVFYESLTGNDCWATLSVHGEVMMNEDFSDVDSASGAGALQVDVSTPGGERRLDVHPPGGSSDRVYRVNGRLAPFDSSARRWLAAVLADFDREHANAPDARVHALLRAGGVPAVLDDIERTTSDFACGAYILALIDQAALADRDVRRVAATTATINSDYGIMRVLLVLTGRDPPRDSTTQVAVLDALAQIQVVEDRGAVLANVAGAAPMTPSLQMRLLGMASYIKADSTVAGILTALASRSDVAGAELGAYLNVVSRFDQATRQRLAALVRR